MPRKRSKMTDETWRRTRAVPALLFCASLCALHSFCGTALPRSSHIRHGWRRLTRAYVVATREHVRSIQGKTRTCVILSLILQFCLRDLSTFIWTKKHRVNLVLSLTSEQKERSTELLFFTAGLGSHYQGNRRKPTVRLEFSNNIIVYSFIKSYMMHGDRSKTRLSFNSLVEQIILVNITLHYRTLYKHLAYKLHLAHMLINVKP